MRATRTLLIGGMVAACAERARAPVAAQELIGTWQALEYLNPQGQDSLTRWPLGRVPKAYLVYDATGHVFFQSVAGIAAAPEVRGRWSEADSAALHSLMAASSAYFGTYSIRDGNSVVHHIEGEIPPNQGTTEVTMPFQVRGDTLQLGRDSSIQWRFVRMGKK